METASSEIALPTSPEITLPSSPNLETMPPNSPETTTTESPLNSIVLPVFGPLPEGASVTIDGIEDPMKNHISKLAVKEYVAKLIEDRDMVMSTAQCYRDKMEELEMKKSQTYCEMHDSVCCTIWMSMR